MTEKLDNKLETGEIKQTRNKRPIIPFRDSAIDRIKKTDTEFGRKRFKEFKFNISKGTSLKGLLLRFSKATERKDFEDSGDGAVINISEIGGIAAVHRLGG